MSSDAWGKAASCIRDYAFLLASADSELRAMTAADGATPPSMTRSRLIINMLQIAWCEAIREEFKSTIKDHPSLMSKMPVAIALMKAAGFNDDDPICGRPGMKPYICTVDGKEAVCFDFSMSGLQPLPLSALFLNKVCEVMDAAEEVGTKNA